MRMSSALLCGAIAALASACEATPCDEASGQECAADPAGSGTHDGWQEDRSFALDQGARAEAGISMNQGDVVDVEFAIAVDDEGAPVAWNVHTHDVNDPDTHSKIAGGSQGRSSRGSFRFIAPADGVYWSLWANDQGTALEIDVTYRGDDSTSFRGWH